MKELSVKLIVGADQAHMLMNAVLNDTEIDLVVYKRVNDETIPFTLKGVGIAMDNITESKDYPN